MIRYLLFIFCFTGIGSQTFAQSVEWEGGLSAAGLFSSEETNPFWMMMNTDRKYGAETQFAGLAEVTGTYAISTNASLEAGVGLYYRDGVEDEFQRRELYLQFRNTWLKATLGSQAAPRVAGDLSATNKNFLMSGNARPLGGIMLEANEPIWVSETFAIDWGLGHYQLNDDRFVDDVRVHYKRLGLLIRFNEQHKLRAQIQHYAQWAGTSPVFGELPSDFEAFIDVFIARKAPEIDQEGEILNAVGNHLGTFLLDYEFKTSIGQFSVYHEHPFEDGSGTRWANFPDGVWGVYFQPNNSRFLEAVLYEYIDTNDQSASDVSGVDNYFRNNVYRSGWSYEGAVIGLPFILIDNSFAVTDTNSPIVSNRVQAHHFGLKGRVKKVDWLLKSSVVSQLGSYSTPFVPELNFWHNYLSLMYDTEKYGVVSLFTAVDSGSAIDTNFGGGVAYQYRF
ncbi:MAG: capsule assembly Wzi family protein [Bacteroidota bacterium]